MVLTLMVLAELGLCQQCPPSSVAFSVVATPSCYSYGLCFRGRYSGTLACPSKTAFDPAKGGCTVEAYNACSGKSCLPPFTGQTSGQTLPVFASSQLAALLDPLRRYCLNTNNI